MPDAKPPAAQVLGQFEAFYQERYRPVVALIYALAGSSWVAEDLAQEAFLRAHRDWQRVRVMEVPMLGYVASPSTSPCRDSGRCDPKRPPG